KRITVWSQHAIRILEPNKDAAVCLEHANEEFKLQSIVLRHRFRAPEHSEIEAWHRLQSAVDDMEGAPSGHAPVRQRCAVEQRDDGPRRWWCRGRWVFYERLYKLCGVTFRHESSRESAANGHAVHHRIR